MTDLTNEELLATDPAAVLTAARAENFPVALKLLPATHRRHLEALYAYARFVDDVGDGALVADPAGRARLLDLIEADLDRVWSGTPTLPVLLRLQDSVRARDLSPEPFHALVGAGRLDLRVHRYPDHAALLGSCRLSADPVGRVVLEIFGESTPQRAELSDSVCSALQLLEHCQDVGEDFRNGTVYLPQDLLTRHGVTEDMLASAGSTPDPVRAAVADMTITARLGLAAGASLVASLSGAARVAVAGFVAGGLATADALDAARQDVLARAVTPARSRVARHAVGLLAGALVTGRRGKGGGR
jgi:squalene synthase HpnC